MTTATSSQYSFTEKKRIRKDFGKRRPILEVPFLLAIQVDSYREFLQEDIDPAKREDKGLHAALQVGVPDRPATPATPRWSTSATSWASRRSTSASAASRGMTYGAPLRVTVRLVIYDRESSNKAIKYVKEQEVYMGEMPLMTDNGTFIVNGTERVIVSQLHRSPGRVLRPRPRQDAQLGQAAVLARASFRTAARGWTSSSTRRTRCSPASTVAASCR